MLAIHFEKLLFLLLIAVALLFQLLTRAASKIRKASKDSEDEVRRSISTGPPVRRAPAETDEERIRRFLEALGQPTTSRPPPPVVPRTDLPPRPVAPVQPPPVLFPRPRSRPPAHQEPRKSVVVSHEGDVGTPGEWLRKINYPRGFPGTPQATGTFEPKISEPQTFEVHEGAPPGEPPPIVKTPAQAYAAATRPPPKLEQRKIEIADLLTSTSGLRNAIILREIFGPPRSLQSLDLVGSS